MFDAPKTPADAYVRHGSLKVAAELDAFVRDRATPDTGVSAAGFWAGVEGLLARFGRRNRDLLERRDELQGKLDDWHRAYPGQPDQAAYQAYLREIGYIESERDGVRAETRRRAGKDRYDGDRHRRARPRVNRAKSTVTEDVTRPMSEFTPPV